MSDMSFVIKYTGCGAPCLSGKPAEKCCLTQDEALTFCVVLRNLGGEAIELVQFVGGQPDAVLDGPDLDAAIARQRNHIERDANPPWR
jgi:hypothetical protein